MPDWTPLLRSRLERLRVSPAREREIVEELSQHLDERYRELLAAGRSELEARRLAIDELEGPDALATSMTPLRQANVAPPAPPPGLPRRAPLADVWADLRYAARVLRRAPGFTAAAVLTLALGIGANSAMFALVDAAFLRPLPFPAPDRLVMLWERSDAAPRAGVSPLNLADWAARNRSFQVIGGYVPNIGGMVMAGPDGTAETVPRQWVTAGVFDALGITPVVGRTFITADDTQGLNVVVLGEAFWRSRFNADPAIVGQSLRLDGEPFTVVGVVPREAEVLGRTSMWAMLQITGTGIPPRARGARIFRAIGRLKPDVSLQAARGDMAAIAEGLAREHPQFNAGRDVAMERLGAAVIGSELRQSAVLFLGVVGFVLLICCGNVANLLLTRATVRRRELAIRAALGADRGRVVRQLLTESLLLAALGAGLGMAVGAGILTMAPSLLPADLMPPGVTLAFDARIATFCAAAALAVGCLFGVAPAWQATRMSSAQTVMAEGRTTTGRGGRLRSVLVVAEVATAVVLLFGAGLLLRTLLELNRVDRGYRAESVLTMIVDPLGSEYPTTESLLQFYETVRQEVSAVPGVRGAAWATTLPMGQSYAGVSAFEVVGEPRDEGAPPVADLQIVSPNYFATIDLPIVAGRSFEDRDVGTSPAVCIVNEAFVRRYFQGGSPIGRQVALRPPDNPQADPEVRQIVGVARQVKGSPAESTDLLQVYTPLAQNPIGDVFLIVTPVEGRAEALTASVRAAIGRIDRKQLVSVRDIMTLDEVTREATARYRFRAIMVVAFAALALLLAMTGLFGTLAYTVQQRVREFGVRRALGATSADVLRLVAVSALRIIGIGAGIGLVLAALTSGVLSTMLYGVRPLDPLTIVSVMTVLVVTAAASVAGPAWRASRVDPVVALRTD